MDWVQSIVAKRKPEPYGRALLPASRSMTPGELQGSLVHLRRPGDADLRYGWQRALNADTKPMMFSTLGALAGHISAEREGACIELEEGDYDPPFAGAAAFTIVSVYALELATGAVVAVAKLSQVRAATDVADRITRADLAAGNFALGRYAWALKDVRALAEPIPLCGRQGIFNWTPPDDLEERLLPAVDHAAACERIGWA